MNFILNKYGYPLFDIKYTNRQTYYTALERAQTLEKDEIFVNFIVKQYLKEYNEFIV